MYDQRFRCALFFFVSVYIVAAAALVPCNVSAVTNTALASPLFFAEEVRDGDIISYDATTGLYGRAHTYADENVFGVVVDDPVLYMQNGTTSSSTRPVVSYGEAVVNVSTLGGEIHAGDLITTSVIPGVGQKADREIHSYVLGFALEPMLPQPSIASITVHDQEVSFGRLSVALRIGPHLPDDFDFDIDAGTTTLAVGAVEEPEQGQSKVEPFTIFRFLLGSFVAIAAIFIAVRRFGDIFSQSVVSVGRNPLARSQIRSILIWNAFLIFMVSGAGLAIGAVIILLP